MNQLNIITIRGENMMNDKKQRTITNPDFSKLREKQLEDLKKAEAIAAKELTNSPGSVLLLQSAIDEFVKGVQENNQQCDAKAYMMTGAILGFAICLLKAERGEGGNT